MISVYLRAGTAAQPLETGAFQARGTLYLVCGPSGAGKDSLIDGAKAALEGDRRFVFPRRVITRPLDAGGEDHRSVTVDTFTAMSGAGSFSLEWQAHGLHYGILREIETDLAAGRQVVVNVSRSVLDAARYRLAPVCVVAVTVSRRALAARLAARGRETAGDVEKRLERADAFRVEGDDIVTIANNGSLNEAVTAFVDLLRGNAGRQAAAS